MKLLVFNTLIILSMLTNILSCNISSSKEEQKIFFDALHNTKSKNFQMAEKLFNILIYEYSNSNNVEDYYYYQDEMYLKMVENIQVDSIQHKPDVPYLKGTVSIGYGDEFGSNIRPIQEKRILFMEQYIRKFETGKHREIFLEGLLFLYTKSDREKILSVAIALSNSKILSRRKYAIFYQAMIAHENNEFMKAIQLYEKLITICIGVGEKAKYQLYLSDCYYKLDNYKMAMKSLDKVIDFEKAEKEKYMSKMAKMWIDGYKSEFNKHISERKQFLFFK